MMKMRMLAVAAALLIASATNAASQCTAETARGRALVTEFATKYGTGTRPAGVPVVSAGNIRLLTNTSDSAVCQQLFYVFMGQQYDPEPAPTGWNWTYYQVGNLYYIVAYRSAPPVAQLPDGTLRVQLGWSPIIVVDQAYNVLATVGR